MPFTNATASYSGNLLQTNIYASEANRFLQASPSYVYTGTLQILNYSQEIIIGPSSHPGKPEIL